MDMLVHEENLNKWDHKPQTDILKSPDMVTLKIPNMSHFSELKRTILVHRCCGFPNEVNKEIMTLRVVPELYCFDINVSKSFFVTVLGFAVKYERPEEAFAYLTLDGVDLMLEGINSDSRKWISGKLEAPLGRGINFQWDVENIEALYRSVKLLASDAIYLQLESKSYECGNKVTVQQQFIVKTPDGYLFRFCQDTL